MKLITVPIASIDASGRCRPVTPAVARQLAADISVRGLRQPVEVAAKGKGEWRLVSGGHRLEACRLLGWAEIQAFEVTGKTLDLRRDELLENLARNELSKLERAQFLARLNDVYLQLNPETAQGVAGGKARQGSATAKLAFAESVAARTDMAMRTIARATAIGKGLDDVAAERLRGTAFEDNQKELEALARQARDEQAAIVDLLLRAEEPAPTVAAAVRIRRGTAAPKKEKESGPAALRKAWNRATPAARRAFLREIAGSREFRQAMAEIGPDRPDGVDLKAA